MNVEARLANSIADRQAIFSFRYRVYVEELNLDPPHADHQHRELYDPLDEIALNYALWKDGKLVGSMRAVLLKDVRNPAPFIERYDLQPALDRFGPAPLAFTSRFMIDPALRHGRVLFRLLETAYRDALARGIRLNYGDCSPHLLPFYEHMGYRRYTRAFNDSTFGYKLPILMLVGDRQALSRTGSPLARLAERAVDDAEAREWFDATYPEFSQPPTAPLLPENQFLDLLQDRVGEDPVHALSLLRGLEQEEADRFLKEATLVRFKAGDQVVREGEHDATLYVLLSGLAEVIQSERPDRPLRVLGAGDSFGEIGFLADVERTASVVTRTDGELLVLSSDFLHRFLRKEPETAAKVLLNLARMLAGRLATVSTH